MSCRPGLLEADSKGLVDPFAFLVVIIAAVVIRDRERDLSALG